MRNPMFDTLIIGQGLAGSALAWQLIAAGQRVGVIDDGHRSSSSMVAAGLINPLAGMRFNRRPELDDWLRAAHSWYAALEPLCGGPIYHPIPMLRLFRSADQYRFHQRRREDPHSQGLLGERHAAGECREPVHAPYGSFVQHQTGYVDLPRLLASIRAWLDEHNALITEPLDPASIEFGNGTVQAGDTSAGHLVFCDGAQLRFNPWFRHLPLAPDKGEILDLRCSSWKPRHIVNGAFWLLPGNDGVLRFGATHEHHALDLATTGKARRTLIDGLHDMLPDADCETIAQHAGIRPATSDRYPLLGRHPQHTRLWVCNGFGARGALTVPWYTQRLAAHLVQGRPLPAEADTGRFA
jgi:glycine/D-amino acid oxidase-like deaminating enzyme